MNGVFISYSHEDSGTAEKLEEKLRARGIPIWRDRESIYAGENWPRAIGEGIAAQRIFLLLWSEHSAISHFVEFEWNTALALKKTIVPLFLDDTELPAALEAKNGIFFDNIDTGVDKILALPDTPAAPDPTQNRRVIDSLGKIKEKSVKPVLEEVKTIYNQQGWVVEGNVYQAEGDINITIKEKEGPKKWWEKWQVWLALVVVLVIVFAFQFYILKKELGLSYDRIEKLIAGISDKMARQGKVGDKPQPVDFSYYLKEWAEKNGFTLEQVKTALNEWAAKAAVSDNYRTKALSHFYRKNFSQAAVNFEKAALQGEERRKVADLGTYENWKDAGNALSADHKFREALKKYRRAGEIVSYENYPGQWIEIRNYIGITEWELGKRVKGEESKALLSSAVDTYRGILAVCTREQLPQQWANTQNNLGAALEDQGIRTGGKDGTRLLGEAVTTYQKALEVRTRTQLPLQWADTQNNLGSAFQKQGIRTAGQEGARLLAQAVTAYRSALQVYTREQLPQQWAMTQNNLGIALKEQGTRTGGQEGARLLGEAVSAYRSALQVYTREQLPQQWATTQNNLGIALKNQGIRTGGQEGARLLGEAVSAYRSALQVRTREQLPQDWAMTQNNLGIALQEQGIRTGGQEGARLLGEAVSAYRSALQVYTREQLPQQWATTQNNLGTALSNQGIRTGGQEGARLLGEAVSAYRSALQVRIFTYLPQDWATTQNNLGAALQEQGIRTGGQEGTRLLGEAVSAYRSALQVRTFTYLPQHWAQTQNNLAKLNEYQEKWPDAIQCYQNVYNVYPAYAADKLASLYHDRVFNFDKALKMNLYLVEQEAGNWTALSRLVENLFTTRLFKEGNQLIVKLKTAAKDSPTWLILLKLFKTANLIALNEKDTTAAQLKTLVDLVSKQAPDYKPDWEFTGTKHFIRTDKTLEPHRQMLLTLFTAFEQTDCETILKKLAPLMAESNKSD